MISSFNLNANRGCDVMLLLFKAHWSRGRDTARKVPGARHEVSMTYDCAAAVGDSDTHRVNAVG